MKKLSLSLLLIYTLTTQILLADMMFYYSAAILPSIVGEKAPITPKKTLIAFKHDKYGFEPTIINEDNTASLIKEINALKTIPNIYTNEMVTLNGIVYFYANDNVHGIELWRSDGSTNGTYMLKDCIPGSEGQYIYDSSSSPFPLGIVAYRNNIYFIAKATEDGKNVLWKSNGTKSGTVQVTQESEGTVSRLTLYANKLFYMKTYYKICSTNGTTHTTILDDPTDGGSMTLLQNINGKLYFISRLKLYSTNGTLNNIVEYQNVSAYSKSKLLHDGSTFFITNPTQIAKIENNTKIIIKEFTDNVNSYGNSVELNDFITLNGSIYFTAYTQGFGKQLWKSDGTVEGTVMVENPYVSTVTNGLVFNDYTIKNNVLYYSQNNPTLYLKTDPSTDQATQLRGPGSVREIAALNDDILLISNSGLWSSFGVPYEEAYKISDVQLRTKYKKQMLFNAGNKLYFPGVKNNSVSLWSTDGTANGTKQVHDIATRTKDSISLDVKSEYVSVKGIDYFVGDDGAGYEIWRTDGTEAGTTMVKNVFGGETYTGIPQDLINYKDNLYFFAGSSRTILSLWKSDGTEDGTVQIGSNQSHIFSLRKSNGLLFFNTESRKGTATKLWISDGASSGTVAIKEFTSESRISNIVSYPGGIYFVENEGLWKSDGTTAGTVLIRSIPNTPSNFYTNISRIPMFYSEVTNEVYFELKGDIKRSDGTARGTRGISYREFNVRLKYVDGDDIYYTKSPQGFREPRLELWMYKRSTNTHVLVNEFLNSQDYGYMESFISTGDKLFFVVDTVNIGKEMWVWDKTTNVTSLLKDYLVGPSDSEINIHRIYQGKVLFSAYDGIDTKLYLTDGTSEGTTNISIVPAP